ncbi:TolC family protein, partial [uncultured Bilophila sp.]
MRILALGLLILGLAGCSFAPEYQRPLMPMPETWKGEVGQGERLDLQWWRRFDDATLNALVEEALTYNRDIAAAVARVDTARARLGVARAELFPLINAEAQGTQTWIDNTKVTAGTEAPFSAGFGATWELDLWGRLRNAREAARYQLLASEAAQRGVQLSVAG